MDIATLGRSVNAGFPVVLPVLPIPRANVPRICIDAWIFSMPIASPRQVAPDFRVDTTACQVSRYLLGHNLLTTPRHGRRGSQWFVSKMANQGRWRYESFHVAPRPVRVHGSVSAEPLCIDPGSWKLQLGISLCRLCLALP